MPQGTLVAGRIRIDLATRDGTPRHRKSYYTEFHNVANWPLRGHYCGTVVDSISGRRESRGLGFGVSFGCFTEPWSTPIW